MSGFIEPIQERQLILHMMKLPVCGRMDLRNDLNKSSWLPEMIAKGLATPPLRLGSLRKNGKTPLKVLVKAVLCALLGFPSLIVSWVLDLEKDFTTAR
mmetsp:Transcript_60144/g.113529  ORF Transcript_60144/g.113529 Transcript_60144/m.113529 type:complete len:98 (-) Transcript_60144:42-335(-)